MSATTEHTELIDRVIEEAFNEGELAVIDEAIASEYELEGPAVASLPQDIRGPEGFKRLVRMWRSAFPDLQMTVEERFVDGNTIIDRFHVQGTHEGEFLGVAPTGREVDVTTIGFHYMEDGKCVADFAMSDMFGLLEQLGVVEAPGG